MPSISPWIRYLISACLIFIACSLSSCSLISYRPTVEQGNQTSPAQIKRLKIGMGKKQVIALLGNPVYNNILPNHKMIYVYTLKRGHRAMTKQKLILNFQHARLQSFSYQ